MDSASGMSIGQRTALYRRLRGLTQEGLAMRLHRSKSWVTKVERGERLSDLRRVLMRHDAIHGLAHGGSDEPAPDLGELSVEARRPALLLLRCARSRPFYRYPTGRGGEVESFAIRPVTVGASNGTDIAYEG